LSEAVIVAIITGGAAIITNIITSRNASKDMQHKLETHQAVTDTKIEELTREVREHNNFAKRMPVVEEQIKVVNHRIEDLEGFHKPH
jgi:septal ring factor EnvC (AmiA/AmiB activator)